jgi:hypothetical protein
VVAQRSSERGARIDETKADHILVAHVRCLYAVVGDELVVQHRVLGHEQLPAATGRRGVEVAEETPLAAVGPAQTPKRQLSA